MSCVLKMCNCEHTESEGRDCTDLCWTEAELQVTVFRLMFSENTTCNKPVFLSVCLSLQSIFSSQLTDWTSRQRYFLSCNNHLLRFMSTVITCCFSCSDIIVNGILFGLHFLSKTNFNTSTCTLEKVKLILFFTLPWYFIHQSIIWENNM